MATYTETNPLHVGPVRRAMAAAGGPATPPREWFDNPNLECPTPLTVTSDGRVYGHLAAWNTTHIGMPGRIKPPHSLTDYAYFKTGVIACADGSEVNIGQLTLSGGHASLGASAGAATRHYDDTASSVADLNVGEDNHGIWMAGALRPDVDDSTVRVLRASSPSGDWRPIGRGLELVAACQVNVPGFPVARARVASGVTMALVAAGAMDMVMRRYRAVDTNVVGRIDTVERLVVGLAETVEPLVAAAVFSKKVGLRARIAPDLLVGRQ